MAIGRISGPLLKANLLRDGVNLAFETDLLFLDVINSRVGIRTSTPSHDLTINGTTRTVNLEATTQADIATFTITGNTVSSSSEIINLQPSGNNPVVYQGKIVVDNLQISTNLIETTGTNTDLNINTTGTGKVNVNSDMLVTGNIHATGNITADGDIVIGDANTDSITFNADISSNILPNQTSLYDLGSNPLTGGKSWHTAYIDDIQTNTITTDAITANGINLILPQGNIIYVAKNGNDSNAGLHENNPVLTIKHALSLASAGTTVYIFSGTYTEIFPLTIPQGVTVKGAGIRSVVIQPTVGTIDKDAILLNGETTVEDISIAGFRFNSSNNTGYAFRFVSNFTVTNRSPYIRNVTVITRGTPTSLSVNSFKTQNNASITRIKDIVDELVVNTTITKSTGNTATQVKDLSNPSNSATGILLQGLIDNIIYVINNGASVASLPAIVANGALTSDTNKLNAAALIAANIVFLKAEMVAYLATTYAGFWTTYNQTKAERDLGYILDAIQYDITHGGNEHSISTGISYWQNLTSDPYGFDSNDAGKGALADGSVANSSSKEASMLFHSVTFITPNQETISVTNGVRIEWLNSFTYFADKGLYAYSSAAGFAGAGLTRLRINTRTGTWNVGNTVTYYDTDGTTVLGTGTIESISGNYVNLTGRCLGFETITDRTPGTVYAQGNAKLSTADKKFGVSSLSLDGIGDYVTHPTTTEFGFGTSDFTIEGWFKVTSGSNYRTIIDMRATTYETSVFIGINTVNVPYVYVNGSIIITGSSAITLNTWVHFALTKNSGYTKLWINGSQQGSTYTDSINYGTTKPVTIGADYTGNYAFPGYIDDIRISKNVARYTSTFTEPTSPLRGDLDTVLLLHFDGNNNSTTFFDDGLTYQDVRTSAGGTANIINFADYSDFGAEIRSIGSANIYGNYGAYGDGAGVIAYLVSQNFAYVGAGKLSTNDPNDKIATQEVVKLNGAKIYFTFVDNEGNFNVGDKFSVNQKTGEVLFDSQNLTVSSMSGITFTDGIDTTIITSADITTGNIRISGNTIESVIGDVNVTSASGSINLENNTFITGNLDVTGDVLIGGNITLGDQFTDTITFTASVNSNLVPATTALYDLGTSSYRWGTAFLNRVEIDTLVIDNNTVSTTANNDDLILTADGTGRIYVPSNDVEIDQNLTVHGITYLEDVEVVGTITHTGDVDQTGTYTQAGNLDIVGDLTVSTWAQFQKIRIDGNVLSASATNHDLVLTANGTGRIYIPSNDVQIDQNLTVSGTTTSGALTVVGTITANQFSTSDILIDDNYITTTISNHNLELRANGTGKINIPTNNVQITNSLTVGQNLTVTTGDTSLKNVTVVGTITQTGDINQTGNFTSSGNTSITGNITGTGYLQLPQVRIENNIISTTATNTDLDLRANGTGNVLIEGLKVQDNNIQSTVTNSDIILTPQGTGSVIINSNQSLIIPVGTTLERPASPTNGMVRYNTTTSRYEARSGSYWIKLGGVEDVSGNTRILAEATPGANDNILYFYANNTLTVTIDSTKLFAQQIETNNLNINNNTISTLLPNTDINFITSGTGGIKVGNLVINNNSITNISNGAITEFIETSTGYVKIAGTNGVVIPSGSNLERPEYAVTGMLRFNTDLQLVEVHNGTTWTGVAGTAGGVTTGEASELGMISALIFG